LPSSGVNSAHRRSPSATVSHVQHTSLGVITAWRAARRRRQGRRRRGKSGLSRVSPHRPTPRADGAAPPRAGLAPGSSRKGCRQRVQTVVWDKYLVPRRMIDFAGQVVIVSGAGRGLGRLYAMEIARRGGSVVVNDFGGTMHGEGSDTRVADQVVDEIEGAGGTAVASYESVASPEGGEAIVRSAVDRFRRLDAVVSNAGIFNSVPFDELSQADWRRMLSVHLDGGFYLSQPAFRVMKSQGYGRFVFMVSSAGLFGQPLEAHYAAAKAGLLGLANVIAIEGGQHGILANTVLPFGHTRMVTESVPDPKYLEESGFLNAIQPELVVPLVVF